MLIRKYKIHRQSLVAESMYCQANYSVSHMENKKVTH